MNINDLIQDILAGKDFSFKDGHDKWQFSRSFQQEIPAMSKSFRILAKNNEGQQLCIPSEELLTPTTKFYSVEENEYFFHALSISEMVHKNDIQKLVNKIRSGAIKTYDKAIKQYQHCSGSLYGIANEIMTSVYDSYYSEERNKIALDLFKLIGSQGDPRACTALADHYLFTGDDIEESLQWRKLAITNGDIHELREYADSIIDYYPSRIDLALEAIHQMQTLDLKADWAYWKESFIYMKGINVETDYPKGFMLAEKAYRLGHQVAKGDLAYFYYKGMGTEKNLPEALRLLEELNEMTRSQNISLQDEDGFDKDAIQGNYEKQIALIKKELNEEQG
jgi:TPR repeat protein